MYPVYAPVLVSCATVLNATSQNTPNTPFTEASPNYPHKNNADNSIKIVFTNSELPKIIHTFFLRVPIKKRNKKKTDERVGYKVTFDRTLET